MTNELAPKTENALSTASPMPAGLEGAGPRDFLMSRFKIWHPMAKAEVLNAKLGLFYEVNSATLAGDTLRFYLLAQVNKQFENDGVKKNSKNMLIVREGQTDLPCELVISGAGLRAVSALNTALLDRSLSDKNQNAFSYLIEAKIEVKENDKGKFGVPKFQIVGTADAEMFDRLAGFHGEMAAAYATGAAGVDTATKYEEATI